MTKVVHLSSVHPAQDTRILHKECRSLVEAGYDVVLIANADHDFEEHGVRVRALPKQKGGRLARMTRQVARVHTMAREEKADLYHFHDPELIPIGLLLRLRGNKVIYDVHESVSKLLLSKEWIPSWARKIVSKSYRLLEIGIGHAFSGIVAATPSIASYFPVSRTIVVQNFPIITELEVPNTSTEPEAPQVAYIGSITNERGIREMVTAIGLIPEEHRVTLTLGGPFAPPSLQDDVRAIHGWERVDYRGVLSRSEVASALESASVGLVTLHPVPNHLDSYPVKLFEYMAAGLPVVASNFPFWNQFVEDVGSGVMVDPMDPQAIADSILEIINDPKRAQQMGEAGAKAVQERFNWDSEAEKLIELVQFLIGTP